MSRLTRDGTAEPVSRDQILRHARGQGNVHFPCSADHEQDWQPYPVDPYSAICDDHTYIHTYILRVNLPRVLYVQELAPLEEPHLVALAQILLHTLGVSFKESIFGIVTDPVDARIFSPDSPHQLLVLGISPLPLPGCSSRGHRHADLCFCLGVSPPTPPRQPGRSRRRDPFCCLQYGCRKGSLQIINTAAAWRKRPEVVSDCCRYLLAQLGVSY